MSLLEDLAASHRLLCEAAFKSAAIGADSGFPSSSQNRPHSPRPEPQASADSPFLNEDEENQLDQAMGFDQAPNPLMNTLVNNQFEALRKQRELMSQDPDTPKVLSRQTRPRIIAPNVDLGNIAPTAMPKGPLPTQLSYEPVPEHKYEESDEVPLEIRFMDDLSKEKEKVELTTPQRRVMPNDVLSDFEQYLQNAGG